ncbi:MAG: hypothetical protein V2B18_06250 [Pseudomonadota bacterium]
MKRIGAYKKQLVLVLVVVVSFHLLGGTGLSCAIMSSHRVPSSEGNRPNPAVAGDDLAGASGAVWNADRDPARNSPCSCKKQKKCPAVPRATLTSNPTHRVNEFQRLIKAVCQDTLGSSMTEARFVTRAGASLVESVCTVTVSFTPTPLELTCILLI